MLATIFTKVFVIQNAWQRYFTFLLNFTSVYFIL
jgi:hypothetical protein